MRYLLFLLLSSCVSDVWSDNEACDAFTAAVTKKAAECGVQPSRNLKDLCSGRIITNNDKVWSECIPRVEQVTCEELFKKDYCQPAGLKL